MSIKTCHHRSESSNGFCTECLVENNDALRSKLDIATNILASRDICISELKDKLDLAVEALKEIKLGRGPFSMDHMEHANNTIEAMKELAIEALAAIREEKREENR